jgi:hypothetical protein
LPFYVFPKLSPLVGNLTYGDDPVRPRASALTRRPPGWGDSIERLPDWNRMAQPVSDEFGPGGRC